MKFSKYKGSLIKKVHRTQRDRLPELLKAEAGMGQH